MQAFLISSYQDEASILSVLLQHAGMNVRTCHDLDSALNTWPEQALDLVVLTLQDEPNHAQMVLRQMRGLTAAPVIVIAEVLTEDMQIQLLDAGADLVLIRPYGIRLLAAQVYALLRRGASMPYFSLPELRQGDVLLDPSSRSVHVAALPPKHLTQLEFRLLYTLMTHAGKIMPSETLVEYVWGYSGEANRELVRGLVQRLRAKLEPDPQEPRYILTEPGIGYFFSRLETSS